MSVTVTYDPQLSRVRVTYTSAPTGANVVRVERSTDQITWHTVRGGQAAELTGGQATVDDYEFAANVVNHYRATPLQFDDFSSTTRVITVAGTWARDTARAYSGRWSYRSGDIGGSTISDTVVAVPPAAVSGELYYLVSSERNFDWMAISTLAGNEITNPGFEDGMGPWTSNVAAEQTTERAREGTHACKVTPDGTSATAYVASSKTPVTAGVDYFGSAWLWFTRSDTQARMQVYWHDDTDTFIQTGTELLVLPEQQWVEAHGDFVAPDNAATAQLVILKEGTPPADDVFYVDSAYRGVQTYIHQASGVVPWTRFTFDASTATGVKLRYTKDINVSEGLDAAFVDDVTFTFGAEQSSITPTLDAVWLKFIARPYFNRAITITEVGEVERPARNGIFEVLGRSTPIAVTSVRGSRRWQITVMLASQGEAEVFDYALATGDPVFLHVPPDCGLPRSMYAVIGDTTMSRHTVRGTRRYVELPLTEVAAPGPGIVGATVTWSDIVATFATWSELIAAETTWRDVTERITDPAVEVTP